MKSKVLKILILILFIGTLVGTAVWMYKNYTLKSPYYQQDEQGS